MLEPSAARSIRQATVGFLAYWAPAVFRTQSGHARQRIAAACRRPAGKTRRR